MTVLIALAINAGAPRPSHAIESQDQQASSTDSAQLAAEAQSALRNGNNAGAIPPLEKLAKLQPTVAELHANLATAYYFSGRYADATLEYRQALKLKPALANAHYFWASLAEDGNAAPRFRISKRTFPGLPIQA